MIIPPYIPTGFRILLETERMRESDWYWNQGVRMWKQIPEQSVGARPTRTVIRRKQFARTREHTTR